MLYLCRYYCLLLGKYFLPVAPPLDRKICRASLELFSWRVSSRQIVQVVEKIGNVKTIVYRSAMTLDSIVIAITDWHIATHNKTLTLQSPPWEVFGQSSRKSFLTPTLCECNSINELKRILSNDTKWGIEKVIRGNEFYILSLLEWIFSEERWAVV